MSSNTVTASKEDYKVVSSNNLKLPITIVEKSNSALVPMADTERKSVMIKDHSKNQELYVEDVDNSRISMHK